jgi:hypothetical protein
MITTTYAARGAAVRHVPGSLATPVVLLLAGRMPRSPDTVLNGETPDIPGFIGQ